MRAPHADQVSGQGLCRQLLDGCNGHFLHGSNDAHALPALPTCASGMQVGALLVCGRPGQLPLCRPRCPASFRSCAPPQVHHTQHMDLAGLLGSITLVPYCSRLQIDAHSQGGVGRCGGCEGRARPQPTRRPCVLGGAAQPAGRHVLCCGCACCSACAGCWPL